MALPISRTRKGTLPCGAKYSVTQEKLFSDKSVRSTAKKGGRTVERATFKGKAEREETKTRSGTIGGKPYTTKKTTERSGGWGIRSQSQHTQVGNKVKSSSKGGLTRQSGHDYSNRNYIKQPKKKK